MINKAITTLFRNLNISREEQDAYGIQSYKRAAAAYANGDIKELTLTSLYSQGSIFFLKTDFYCQFLN